MLQNPSSSDCGPREPATPPDRLLVGSSRCYRDSNEIKFILDFQQVYAAAL